MLTENQARPTAEEAAAAVKLMGFDVDGTLTDGGLYFSQDGEAMKRTAVPVKALPFSVIGDAPRVTSGASVRPPSTNLTKCS